MILLPTAYLGNIQYYSKLLSGHACIDLHEHYLKQSWRNRCDILSAGGIMSLTVPVYHTGGINTPTREIRIDYAKRWQHQHWQAIVSAYRGAPYFDHYEGAFAPLFTERFEKLVELNNALLEVTLRLLDPSGKIADQIAFTDHYWSCDKTEDSTNMDHSSNAMPASKDANKLEGEQVCDLRTCFSPKPRLSRPDPTFTAPQYYQTFSDRLPFAPNLSIIDLLFCEGPASADILRSAYHKP